MIHEPANAAMTGRNERARLQAKLSPTGVW
jgi:hypothetical protein